MCYRLCELAHWRMRWYRGQPWKQLEKWELHSSSYQPAADEISWAPYGWEDDPDKVSIWQPEEPEGRGWKGIQKKKKVVSEVIAGRFLCLWSSSTCGQWSCIGGKAWTTMVRLWFPQTQQQSASVFAFCDIFSFAFSGPKNQVLCSRFCPRQL